MTDRHHPSLADLAFEGRNKSYGAYFLRKRYVRNLVLSMIAGFLLVSLVVFIPFLYYVFEPVPLVEGDLMYDVQYMGPTFQPDDELSKLLKEATKLPEKPEQAPVVTDSVKPEEVKPPDEPDKEKKENDPAKEDTIAKNGGTGLGAGAGDDTGIANSVDVYPRFPGGEEARLFYLRQHVRYPDDAYRKNIQGIVLVTFIVELDGTLSRVDVLNRVGGGCDEEAIRVTKTMPKWDPGKRAGKAVRVMVRMPIVFRIPGKPATR